MGTATAPLGKAPSITARIAELSHPELRQSAYRWIFPDCNCFYTDNLYVKEACGLPVHKYFTNNKHGSNDGASYAQFWAENADHGYSEEQKKEIWETVQREVSRRRNVPLVYAKNSLACAAEYEPLFPELFIPPSRGLASAWDGTADSLPDIGPGLPASDIFLPQFMDIWRAVIRGEAEVGEVQHVHAECFELPLFQPSFCKRIVKEIENFKAAGIPHQFPNAMNREGCILNEIGFGPFMDRLIHMYIGPVATKYYARFLGEGIDSHHSFIVGYSEGTDVSLSVHDDNSEVTVNIALRDDYEGASLALYQHSRTPQPTEVAKDGHYWRAGAGKALMHPGEMLHEVLPLKAGKRMGLIIWLRSTKWRSKNGCPLCLDTKRLIYVSGPDGTSEEVLRDDNLN